jgi:hypothetical protein
MDKFNEDFEFFWSLIDQKINFTFSRYADGEVMLMKGKPVNEQTQAFRVDNWKAPEGLSKLGSDLLSTLNHTEDNYYYAISTNGDNPNDYSFLKENIKQNDDKLTFVNLWINANYGVMKHKLDNLNRDVVMICNWKACKDSFPFKVIDMLTFPDNCVSFWEENSEWFVKELTEKFNGYNNTLFLVSCGPVSEVIIDALYNSNPNNTYVDVGSSIDEYVHGKKTRPYMDPQSQYYYMKSNF